MRKNEINRISFNCLHKPFYLPERTRLKEFILNLFRKEGCKVEAVNYIFCSDEYLLGFNKTYLKHNTYTDIITFEYTDPGAPALADIYISIDRVRENAEIFHTSFVQELYRVMFHGALHLCGYMDKTKRDSTLMRSKEEFFLTAYVPREKRKL